MGWRGVAEVAIVAPAGDVDGLRGKSNTCAMGRSDDDDDSDDDDEANGDTCSFAGEAIADESVCLEARLIVGVIELPLPPLPGLVDGC